MPSWLSWMLVVTQEFFQYFVLRMGQKEHAGKCHHCQRSLAEAWRPYSSIKCNCKLSSCLLYMATVTHPDRYGESIDFWQNVYGINMSAMLPLAKQCAFEEPSVESISASDRAEVLRRGIKYEKKVTICRRRDRITYRCLAVVMQELDHLYIEAKECSVLFQFSFSSIFFSINPRKKGLPPIFTFFFGGCCLFFCSLAFRSI
ncbi:PREDICTED: uncharacterized protein LOC105116189 isoform X2 [Populus euphratica]|uniref:Uncharacterized protein LOC105116189 isoform X2 n=1 Tax=Populus euphratica TaxID=75702 RepID=A0AAJ6XAT4_POPEU|nr:PREDICTED: uncharacterized protein LOC105116189 isoform X2 [Populus euphratica]